MRKYIYLFLVFFLSLGFLSCERDNYDAPDAGIYGKITDDKGQPFQTTNGTGNVKIRILEKSWGDGTMTITPQYLNVKNDGTYKNTKLFAGDYDVIPEQGAFYPLTDSKLVTLDNGLMTECNFTVIPYLRIIWVQEPYVTSDNMLKCKVKFERVRNGDIPMPDVDKMQLYISHVAYPGNTSDGNYTPAPIIITNSQEGEEIELISKAPFKYSSPFWIRVGASCKDLFKKSNFTDIKKIDVVVK